MLMIPNQLEGARRGVYSKLECHTEANPPSINYWTNERGDMIVSGTFYDLVVIYHDVINVYNVMYNESYCYAARYPYSKRPDPIRRADELPAATS